jgi:hypothetical protein
VEEVADGEVEVENEAETWVASDSPYHESETWVAGESPYHDSETCVGNDSAFDPSSSDDADMSQEGPS